MNKKDLLDHMAKKGGLETLAAAEKALAAVLGGIQAGLKDKSGDDVRLVGFGTFRVSKRKARDGRNPQTGATIKIKASKTVTFKPGKPLKESL